MTAAADSTIPAETRVAWDGGDLVIARGLQAPRELVYAAWTTPEHFARWFGPEDSTLSPCTMDVRPGGTLHYCHRFDGVDDVWVKGVYTDVAEPERIAFRCWFSDAAGSAVPRPGYPAEMHIAVAFDEAGAGTLVTIRQAGLPADHGEVQGWREGLDRLARLLAND
jgi:uncharacterized protein YndB with AHSA1/START domain